MKLEALREICAELFEKSGVPREDAEIISEVLLVTEMRGVKSHGLMRVERYVDCLLSGGIKPRADIRIEKDSPSRALMDGGGGPGIVISYRAMNLAIEKAGKTGIGMVCVKNSHHFGAAGYYTMMCAEKNMAGIAMSNADPLMAVTGGASRTIGNNPFSYAVPAGKYGAVMLDIAMSQVADGKIQIAKKLNQRVPEGSFLDSGGRPSTDPDDYFNGGVLLPFGGHKGYGLALMVECLAGVLSGAAVTKEVKAWNEEPGKSGNTGHFFLAVDIEDIMPSEDFKARMVELVEEMLAAPRAENAGRILYPGQLELEREREARAVGAVELEDSCVESLERTAARLGASWKGTNKMEGSSE